MCHTQLVHQALCTTQLGVPFLLDRYDFLSHDIIYKARTAPGSLALSLRSGGQHCSPAWASPDGACAHHLQCKCRLDPWSLSAFKAASRPAASPA